MKQTILITLLALVLTACSADAPSDQATTSAIDNAYATALAGPMTNNSDVRPSKSNGGTATAVSGGSATVVVATPIESATPVIVPTATHTSTATARPKPRPSATATATAPLTFVGMGTYVVSCRSVPTTDKPGLIIIQISIEVMGGNGVYQYFDNDGQLWPTKFIDVQGDRGTASIGKVKITTGDGQMIEKEYYIQPGDLTCS